MTCAQEQLAFFFCKRSPATACPSATEAFAGQTACHVQLTASISLVRGHLAHLASSPKTWSICGVHICPNSKEAHASLHERLRTFQAFIIASTRKGSRNAAWLPLRAPPPTPTPPSPNRFRGAKAYTQLTARLSSSASAAPEAPKPRNTRPNSQKPSQKRLPDSPPSRASKKNRWKREDELEFDQPAGWKPRQLDDQPSDTRLYCISGLALHPSR